MNGCEIRVWIFKIKEHLEKGNRKNKMLSRDKVLKNRDLVSLPMESLMPGRVADIKAALQKERMRISKVQRNHSDKQKS